MQGWTCIILGVTGDLSRRKLLPALYHIVREYQVDPEDIAICGAAYEDASFEHIWDEAVEYIDDVSFQQLDKLKSVSRYHAIDFTSQDGFASFSDTIEQFEQNKELPGKRLIYLATPADFFCQATKHLANSGVIEPGNQHHRIVYEKPFGWDVQSAHDINACIQRHGITQEQVYRVDHYLTKEFINNIVLLRFTNRLFDATWSNEHIQRVEIACKEEVTVASRGAYYDRYGAIRDMIQSHMLQMLALTAMERPDLAVGHGMEDEKAHVLRNTAFVQGVRGQYVGYRAEEGVADESTTETAAALEWRVHTPRWQGVPFYTFTGKALDEKLTEIRIVYHSSHHALFRDPVSCESNVLIIRIAPETGFVLQVNSKRPNSMRETMPVPLDFCHSCQFAPYTMQAYEALLMSVISGEASVSVSGQEIEAQWELAEKAVHASLPLERYNPGDTGDQLRTSLW